MATLLKWAQNTQGKLSSNKASTNGERKWIHPPEALQKGHIAYLVKFLGNTLVDEAKGIEVVKEAIRKLKFTQQLRKSETGAKTKKVELTISIDGVAIQEPRTHSILHQFPLHQISYCADDKGEKKFFSFIAKQHQEDEPEEKHECFVFISDKLAEEITLTIGQAFELAYRRFLETSGKDLEAQRKAMVIQQKIKKSEQEVNIYKQRLLEISQLASIKSDIDQYLRQKGLRNILDVDSSSKQNRTNSQSNHKNGHIVTRDLLDIDFNGTAPPVPPRASENTPAVGTKLEGLLLNELEHDDFNPRSFENNNMESPISPTTNLPLIAPPPKPAKRNNLSLNINLDSNTRSDNLLHSASTGSAPNSVSSAKTDPFEMGDFGGTSTTSQDIENAIGLLDKRILEMKAGFTRGISFGNDDFSLDDLDPLKN